MVRDSVVRIGLVLPDVLGTYGDSGNATVLRGGSAASASATQHRESLYRIPDPLGMKGVGESGALPVPAVLASAIERGHFTAGVGGSA